MNFIKTKSYLKNDSDFNSLNYSEIMKERIRRLEVINNDRRIQIALKSYYSKNPISFIEDWITTYDSRSETKTMPFILFKRQKQMIDWIYNRYMNQEDGLIEKSREVGATYLCVAFSIWMFLFQPETTVGFCSLKAERADKIGNPDTILEKGRMMLRLLPKFLLPNGFNVTKHCKLKLFENKENGSKIIAEGGDNVGRGGRCTIYFKDEAAFYERPEIIEAALSQTSRCKIDLSTINKIGSPFYLKRHSGSIPIFEFDWKDDPRKNEKWHDEQIKKYGKTIVAREIDRNWHADDNSVCIPAEWVRHSIKNNINEDEIEGYKYAGLDVADDGGDRNVLVIRKGNHVIKVIVWSKGNTHFTANKAFIHCMQEGVKFLSYDGIGIGAGLKGEFEKLSQEYSDYEMIINNVKVSSAAPKNKNILKKNKLGQNFLNLKAYLWYSMRYRFEKTYEYEKNGVEHDKEGLVYILNHSELINELSIPCVEYKETGKIQIESKKSIKKRGIRSTDIADAFMLAFYSKDNRIRVGNI